MNGVHTVFILIDEDCSAIFVSNACNVVLHYVLAQLQKVACPNGIRSIDFDGIGKGYFSYDRILQTQDCDYIAQHLQLDKSV